MTRRPDRDLRTLLAEEEALEAERSHVRHLRLASLLIPIGAAIVLLALAAVFRGPAFASKIAGQAVAIFTVLGKFAILLGADDKYPFSAWELALLVSYMDISIATILVFNLPRLYGIRRVGPALEDLAEHGLHMLEQQRWLGRITFLGVIAFVMFPLTGTGAIGGSIFGRLLGLSPVRTLVAIAIGAFAGSFAMAAFAESIAGVFTPEVRDSWEFRTVGIAVVVVMIAIVWWRGRKLTQQLRVRRDARQRGGDAPRA